MPLIMKTRLESIQLRTLRVLINRLSESHDSYPYVDRDFGKAQSGANGEKKLNYHLSLLPESQYILLNNLRLPTLNNHSFFQIDSLLLSPTHIIILEAKNIAGTLYFDPQLKQMYRVNKDIEQQFEDPISQVEQQALQLKFWLERSVSAMTSIESLVTLCHPTAKIVAVNSPNIVAERVTHAKSLFNKILSFQNKYQKELYSQSELEQLAKQLIRAHTPRWQNLLEIYKIHRSEIIQGIQCPSCKRFGMKRNKGIWVCGNCKNRSKDGHHLAIRDYSLLFGQTITNQELRSFLMLDSASVSQKLLKKMHLERRGITNKTFYLLPKLFD